MKLRDRPIRHKLMSILLLISGLVLLLSGISFFSYELISFKRTTIRHLSTLADIIADNSTASLAFDDSEDAGEILGALKAEKHIRYAGLYDNKGKLFSYYNNGDSSMEFSKIPDWKGYRIVNGYLEGIQPVIQGKRRLGTLFLASDLGAIYNQIRLFVFIGLLVVMLSFILAYLISNILQKRISEPILYLAKTAKSISEKKDFSVRAEKSGNDEIGSLTDAFNQMLSQLEIQNKKLSEFNQNLEEKISERTEELELANKELEAFSYSVSHDLRAPLRAINGYIRIFHVDYFNKFDEEGKKLMQIIMDNARKMGLLIDDLLQFSRLGRKELSKSQFDMKELVYIVWNELKKNETDREIKLNATELPVVYADQPSMKQVWANLISNAIKYTRIREEALIEIGMKKKEGESIFYVKDNGAGFDMKYYNKLFGVFQRLHSENEFEGTGVGLAIVERIITKHDGKVWAESVPDRGATFYFTLGDGAFSGF